MHNHEWAYRVLGKELRRAGVTCMHTHEFIPPHRETPPAQRLFMIVPTAIVLQAMRDAGCGRITVSSGYRPPWYNEQIGGAPFSQHLYFTASDITTEHWTPDQVADWLEQSDYAPFIAVGRYNTFTHLDTRHWTGNPEEGKGPARWDNRRRA